MGIRLEIPSSDESDEVNCEWMEAFIDSPSFLMSNESKMKFDSFQIGPCSHGQLSLCVPQTSLCLGGDSLMTVNGVIDVSVESKAVGEEVQGFLMRMMETFDSSSGNPPSSALSSSTLEADSPSSSSSSDSALIPFPMKVAGIKFSLLEPKVGVTIKDIEGPSLMTEQQEGALSEGATAGDILLMSKISLHRINISSVSLTLPNATMISVPSLSITYRNDRSYIEVEGRGNIQVDEITVFALRDGSKWLADLVNSKFIIGWHEMLSDGRNELTEKGEHSSLSEALVSVHCRQDVMKKVMEGKDELAATFGDGDEKATKELSDVASPTESSTEWSLEIKGSMGIRLEIPSSDESDEVNCEWMEAFIDSPSFLMSNESKMKFDSFQIGPCSHGQLSLCVPQTSLCLGGDSLMTVNGVIDVSVESKAVGEEVQGFLMRMMETFQSQSNELSLPQPSSLERNNSLDQPKLKSSVMSFDVAGVNFASVEPNAKVVLGRINGNNSGFNCVSLFVQEEDMSAFTNAIELKVSIKPKLNIAIKELKSFHLPGVVSLLKPSSDVLMSFEGDTFCLKMASLEATMLSKDKENEKEHKKVTEGELKGSTPNESTNTAVIPFPVSVNLQKLHVVKSDDGTVLLDSEQFSIDATPVDAATGASASGGYIQVITRIGKGKNKMFGVDDFFVTARINPDNTNEIHQLNAAAKSVSVTAGYSVSDWTKIFKPHQETTKDPEPTKPLMFPDALIQEMKLRIAVDSNLVGAKETVVNVPTFKGKSNTSLNDLVKYYSGAVLRYVPNFITNAEVLGANVADTAMTSYGATLGAATMGSLGSAAGGVGGLIAVTAFDGVKSIASFGKKSRHAESDDKGDILDIVRGIPYAAKETAKAGAAKRGKGDGSEGNVVDWAVGATSDGSEYIVENKSRLGAAGAGGVGFIVGTAVAGPLGGVAGAMLVSAVTGKAIDEVDKGITKLRKELNTSAPTSIQQQGVLAKQRRGGLKLDWCPHWFVLDSDSKVLNCFSLSYDKPTSVKSSEQAIYIDDAKGPKESLHLDGCKIEVNVQSSDPTKNVYALTLTPKASKKSNLWNFIPKPEESWILAAVSQEERSVWMEQIAKSS